MVIKTWVTQLSLSLFKFIFRKQLNHFFFFCHCKIGLFGLFVRSVLAIPKTTHALSHFWPRSYQHCTPMPPISPPPSNAQPQNTDRTSWPYTYRLTDENIHIYTHHILYIIIHRKAYRKQYISLLYRLTVGTAIVKNSVSKFVSLFLRHRDLVYF